MLKDNSLKLILMVGVVVSIVTTFAVIGLMGYETAMFFQHVSWIEFFTHTVWEPLIEPRQYGVLPLITGTMMVALGAILIALPVGLFSAFYLSELANDYFREFLKPMLEILAGIPTVVYGYFALSFVTPVLRIFNPDTEIFNALSAVIVVAIMILPMVTSLCDDAFRALPRELKEGAYSLGATTNEVMLGILVPAASGRIVAAVMLALSRAAGETMAVTLAAGSTPKLTLNFLESIQTMTAFMVQVSLGDVAAHGPEYLSSYAVGALLFVITFILNGIGTYMIFKAPKGL